VSGYGLSHLAHFVWLDWKPPDRQKIPYQLLINGILPLNNETNACMASANWYI